MPRLMLRNKTSTILDHLLRVVAASVCVWTLAASTTLAQEIHARSLVSSSQIIAAMQDQQLPTRGVQVILAAPITSTVTNPPLDIKAIAYLNAQDVRLRLTCRDRSACLPFFAVASYPQSIDAAAFQIKPSQQSNATAQRVAATNPIAEAPAAPPSKPANYDALVVRSGSPATLDFDGERVHVRVEVICLQSGAAGDRIRVTTRDHKQIYLAEIVTPNALKGTLTR